MSTSSAITTIFVWRKVSENRGQNSMYFSGKLYKCVEVVLGHFPNINSPSLEARGKATSILKYRQLPFLDSYPRLKKFPFVLHISKVKWLFCYFIFNFMSQDGFKLFFCNPLRIQSSVLYFTFIYLGC